MPKGQPEAPDTDKDLEDIEIPEWTAEDFADAKPFSEVFPELAASYRRTRGPQKAPTKKLVSLRLDPDIVEHFRSQGRGWQSRINDTLRKVMERETAPKKLP